jgi:methionyl-tRNA synthetase
VWWDALANYVTALDYAGTRRGYDDWWKGSQERIHIIGKGIVRFHAVYWLALLTSAGLPLPTTILVHDYITASGRKLSKSASAGASSPIELIEAYGTDAVRWWLLADVARVGDTEFSAARLVERANTDLANGIGNLVNRVTGLWHAADGAPAFDRSSNLATRIDDALSAGDFRAATLAIRAVVEDANRLLAAEQPWRLRGKDATRFRTVLARLTGTCIVLATELGPFLPDASRRLLRALGGERPAGPVFPRIGLIGHPH